MPETIDLTGDSSDEADATRKTTARGSRRSSSSGGQAEARSGRRDEMLMPGEEEARRTGEIRKWELRPSRDYDARNPGDVHFRTAESQWGRTLGANGATFQLASVHYACNPRLMRAFEAKRAEYDRKFGAGKHLKLLAFHGTKPELVDKILAEGFRLDKVGSTTDAGFFGRGIYFSEHASYSIGYCNGGNKMLLCRVLLGKPYIIRNVQTGRKLEPGHTSHMCDEKGTEVVIFDEAAMLPLYVLTFNVRGTTTGAALLGGPPAAPASVALPAPKERDVPMEKRKRGLNSALVRDGSDSAKAMNNLYKLLKKKAKQKK